MIKCPVCPFENIPTDATHCPSCNTDLLPIRRINELSAQYFNQALELVKGGKIDTAMVWACSAIAIDSEFVTARKLLGKLLWKKKRPEEALQQWEEATRIDPNNEEVRNIAEAAKKEIQNIKTRQKIRRIAGIAAIAILLFVGISSYDRLRTQLSSLHEDLILFKTKTNTLQKQLSEYQKTHRHSNDEVKTLKNKLSILEIVEKKEKHSRSIIANLLNKLGKLNGVVINQENNVAVLVLSEGLFPAGDILSSEAKACLTGITRVLQNQGVPLKILVEGHTNNIPVLPTSRWANNWSLGLSRANVVLSYMKENFNIPHIKLMTCSAGELNPPFSNESKESKKQNRTVVFCFSVNDKEE